MIILYVYIIYGRVIHQFNRHYTGLNAVTDPHLNARHGLCLTLSLLSLTTILAAFM